MPISSPVQEDRKRRHAAFVALVLGGFGLIVLGLLRLQVVQHDKYLDLAKENRVRLEVLRAPRGVIYDRKGRLLADSAPNFTILFQPFPAESAHLAREVLGPRWTRRVSRLLGVDSLEIAQRVAAASHGGQSAVLLDNAPFAVLAGVEELHASLPGIEVQVQPLRRYPHGTLASHLLGYANEVNERDLAERADQGYRPGDLIGRSGVERSYEDLLRGRDGAEFVVVNAMGQRVSTLTEGPPRRPVPGHDLVLSLDLDVQQALEEAMADVKRGAAVAIDPRDGGVLGLVSRPAFDPNEFSRGLSVRRWNELSSGGSNPLLDRAIQGVYPPGSTFKIVSMLAALRTGVASASTRLAPCYGYYVFGNRRFGCWLRTGHGSLDFIGALVHSCDVYFYQIGPMLGLPRLDDMATDFGFGARTGIDLPQEARGLVPTPAYYDRHGVTGRWRQSLLLNLAIGQGELLVTPLQLALMMAEVANGGHRLRPHVVQTVRGVDGFEPEKPTRGPIEAPASAWNAVHKGLEEVVTEGTAQLLHIPGIHAAGKTGTAQNPHGRDHALLVCYAPVDTPTIAMAFVIENGGHGGSAAGPRAAFVLRRMFLPDSLQQARPLAVAPMPADTAGVVRGD